MKNQKDHLSIWLILNMTRLSFWVSAAIAIVFTIRALLILFGVPLDFHPEHYLSFRFEVVEKGAMNFMNSTTLVKITNAVGELQFDKLPNNVLLIISFSLLPLLGASLLGLWFFKKFLSNVKLGQVFQLNNIQYLKNISYVLLASWLYSRIIAIVYYFFIYNTVVFETLKIQLVSGQSSVLYLSLFIWVLSHVFKKGVEIEEENSLTI